MKRFDAPRERESSPWLHRHRDAIAPGIWVLDLGCGAGEDAAELADYGCQVAALDLDPGRLALVPPRSGIRLRISGDVAVGLPFVAGCFDAIIASLSLHYFDTPTTDAAISELVRVLKPSGILICRVNAVDDWNFGYRQGPEIEPGLFFLPDGRLKRFFDENAVEKFFARCFTLDRVVPMTILQHGRQKQTLEWRATKRQ